MSRHGRRGRLAQPHPVARPSRPASPPPERPAAVTRDAVPGHLDVPAGEPARLENVAQATETPTRAVAVAAVTDDRERDHLRPPPATGGTTADGAAAAASQDLAAREGVGARQPQVPGGWSGDDMRPTCTVAQLRRFIKSRPWVPMHELRRRFGINGVEDDVTPIRVRDEQLYIGLPSPEARLMAELLGGGDVGYELSLDPGAPVVVGVYPMRPVPRS